MSSPVVLRAAGNFAGLFRAAIRVVTHANGRVAIVGGIAVTCRLQQSHRATQDVDTVCEDQNPTIVEILCRSSGIEGDSINPDRITVDGVKVDVISTAPIDDISGLDGLQRLFVVAHRHALDSAEPVSVILDLGDSRIRGELPLPSAAALVATKLHAIQDRRGQDRQHKEATDAYDLYRLLLDLDGGGAVARSIVDAGQPLLGCVRDAATEVLVVQATKTVRPMRAQRNEPMADVTVDDLQFLGERFVERLVAPPR